MSRREYRSLPRRVRRKRYQGGASNPGGYEKMPEWAIRKTKKFDYHAYLASREWALKRRQIHARSSGLCERHLQAGWAPQDCPAGEAVHHLTYRHVGHEPLEDLVHVCRPCHEWLSAKRDDDPTKVVAKPSYPVQPTVIRQDDLTDDEQSEEYWQVLLENRIAVDPSPLEAPFAIPQPHQVSGVWYCGRCENQMVKSLSVSRFYHCIICGLIFYSSLDDESDVEMIRC